MVILLKVTSRRIQSKLGFATATEDLLVRIVLINITTSMRASGSIIKGMVKADVFTIMESFTVDSGILVVEVTKELSL